MSGLKDSLFNGLDKVDKLKKTSLSEKFSSERGQLITWDNLINNPIEVWTVLEGCGVRFKRVEHPEYECYYITEMDPELSKIDIAKFGLQWHDCKEIGEVLEGELIEETEQDKLYEKGDFFIFPVNHKHLPYSKTKAVLGVQFINPNK